MITIIVIFCKREDVPFPKCILECAEAEDVWYCSSAMGLCLHLELLKLNVKTASQHLKVLITLIQTAQSSPQNR